MMTEAEVTLKSFPVPFFKGKFFHTTFTLFGKRGRGNFWGGLRRQLFWHFRAEHLQVAQKDLRGKAKVDEQRRSVLVRDAKSVKRNKAYKTFSAGC
jgi:hypothetical protein